MSFHNECRIRFFFLLRRQFCRGNRKIFFTGDLFLEFFVGFCVVDFWMEAHHLGSILVYMNLIYVGVNHLRTRKHAPYVVQVFYLENYIKLCPTLNKKNNPKFTKLIYEVDK